MNEKVLNKNTSFSINFNRLVLAIIIPALIGSIWLISALLIAVGMRKASSQPLSLFFLSFFGIYFQAALIGVLSPILLKDEAKSPFVVLISTLASEVLALAGFYCFLRVYYGSWFLPVITLTEPLNDSFLLVSISIIISLLYYWLFVYTNEPVPEISEETVSELKEEKTQTKKNSSSSKRKKAKSRKSPSKSR